MAYAHLPEFERRRLDCLFVPKDVKFNENYFGHKVPVTTPPASEPTQKGEELERPPVPVKSHVQVEEEEEKSEQKASDAHQEPQCSQRSHKPPIRYGYDEYAGIVTHCVHHAAYNVREVDEPSTMREALASDHATEWKAAADSEYNLLVENETWGLVELLPGRNAFGCIWVFNVKHRVDGTVERFKARFGAPKSMRLTMTTPFGPVVRFSSIRALLAFSVQNDMLLHLMVVATALF